MSRVHLAVVPIVRGCREMRDQATGMNVATTASMRFALAFLIGLAAAPAWGCHSGPAVGQCGGLHDLFGPKLRVQTFGLERGVYDGAAVVERSTSEELILYFEAAAAGDAGTPVVRRATLSGLAPMPLFPVGGRVWLSKDPAGSSPFSPYQRAPGWALSMRDREGGRLLLGAAVNSTSPAAPIAVGERTDTCAEHNPACSGPDARVFYEAVEVRGDSLVTIEDSETAIVRLDGNDYEVRVTARHETSDSAGCASDYYADNAGGVSVDVQAADLSQLIDGLE
jgi:hypothetical protein